MSRPVRTGWTFLAAVWLSSPRCDAAHDSIEAQGKWWLDEPIRFLQTNLSETDSTLDPKALVAAVAEFPGQHPPLQHGRHRGAVPDARARSTTRARSCRRGAICSARCLRRAHARGIRVVGRFDLSKTQKPVFDAHPEWFFKRANGEPAIYNGLYSACINGGYYREHAMKILDRSARALRGRRAVLQHVREPVGRLQRQCRWDRASATPARRGFRPATAARCRPTRDADYRAFMAESVARSRGRDRRA